MKYFEMFTGIAGFSKGIEQAYESIESAKFSGQELRRGGRGDSCESGFGQQQHSCIGFSEIASVPCGILKYHYPDIRNYGNAAELVCDELPDFDFLCGGFPCQSFSIAGKRGGFEDARGTLFFEIARVLKAKRPLYALLENVKGLVSHDGGRTLEIILETLQEIGYFVDWEIHNSKHYGVPQNRERIFFICYSTDLIRDGHQTMTQPCVEIIKQWMFQALQNRWAGAVRRQGAVSKDWVLGFAILEESVAALGPAMKCESLKLIWRNLFGNYNPSYQGDLFKESSIKPVHWEDPKSIVAGILTAMAENRLQSAAVDPWQSIDLLLRSVWEENSPDKKPFTTSTSIKHITQTTTYTYFQMFLLILNATAHLRSSFDLLWNEVLSDLTLIQAGMNYARIHKIEEGIAVTESGVSHIASCLESEHQNITVGHLGTECQREILSFGESNKDITGSFGQRNDVAHTITNDDKARGSYILSKDGQVKNQEIASCFTAGGHSGGNHSDMDLIAVGTRQNWDSYKIDRRIRRLTPVECARLQGFPDNWCDFGTFQNKQGEWHVREISDTGKYQCAGNAVTVNVIEAIITRMLEKGCLE